MKEIIVLSAKHYPHSDTTNYGDCVIINTGTQLFVYDCGSSQHAEEVISYMDRNGYKKATVILSHNDSDHFDGIPTLVENNRVSAIRTVLLLKYVDEILNRIDDKRRKRDAVKAEIKEKYDNIASLSGCNLEDIYECDSKLCDEVSIVGPDFNYMLDTVAKHLDGREGDTMDGETAYNAASVQIAVTICSHSFLLCGDCSFASIEDKVRDHDIVQLPHHGKVKQAKQIFEKKYDQTDAIYIVSDNTGNSNGGSDARSYKGHQVYNTKNSENITLNPTFFKKESPYSGRSLGV